MNGEWDRLSDGQTVGQMVGRKVGWTGRWSVYLYMYMFMYMGPGLCTCICTYLCCWLVSNHVSLCCARVSAANIDTKTVWSLFLRWLHLKAVKNYRCVFCSPETYTYSSSWVVVKHHGIYVCVHVICCCYELYSILYIMFIILGPLPAQSPPITRPPASRSMDLLKYC